MCPGIRFNFVTWIILILYNVTEQASPNRKASEFCFGDVMSLGLGTGHPDWDLILGFIRHSLEIPVRYIQISHVHFAFSGH